MDNQANKTNDWLEMQRQYWDTWTEIGRKAMGLERVSGNPWIDALDQWWKGISNAAEPNNLATDFMQKLMDQGKGFFAITDSLTKGLKSGHVSGPQGWDLFSQALEEMQKVFSGGQWASQPVPRLMALWEMPFDNWQRTMSSLSPVPGDLLRNMPHDHPVRDSMNRILSAPGLGYTREEQAQYKDLIRRSIDYQSVLQEYAGFFTQLGVKAVERMRTFLQQQAEEGKTIESARVLYDSWVGCCEEVYAEEVSSPDYARIHGHLVNAQMALKQQMSIVVDETLGTWNMPTRTELRTLQDRLQETRRENMRQRQEIEHLKHQVQRLTEAGKTPSAGEPAAATKRATPARRRTTATKSVAK